jgi:hypothetical protein
MLNISNTFHGVNRLITLNIISLRDTKSQLAMRLERGDADSGGSTLRTLGVVTLIVLVVAAIGAAILIKGNDAADVINNVAYPW